MKYQIITVALLVAGCNLQAQSAKMKIKPFKMAQKKRTPAPNDCPEETCVEKAPEETKGCTACSRPKPKPKPTQTTQAALEQTKSMCPDNKPCPDKNMKSMCSTPCDSSPEMCKQSCDDCPENYMKDCKEDCMNMSKNTSEPCDNSMMKTDSGMMHMMMRKPATENAPMPKMGSRVSVHYTGWLADADGMPMMEKQFDSSVKRGTPFMFNAGMGEVIKGWDEGIMMMKKGEKRRFVIPADMAYGARGVEGIIPPNATLVFDVELLEIMS